MLEWSCFLAFFLTTQLKAVEFVQKNGALEGAESNKTKKSAAIAKKVEENRTQADKEGI